MFGIKNRKKEKKNVDVDNLFRKSLGFYSTGFIILSDALAYFVKKTLMIVHDFIPLVLLHRGVDILQSTKDSIGKSLTEFTYCPKCSGNGVIFGKGDDGKTQNQICPMCHGMGKLDINLSKERCNDGICITGESQIPLAPFSQIEEMIKSSKKEWEKTHAYCSKCNGKGVVTVTGEDSEAKEKNCPSCHGTGKDYGELARELMNRCAGDFVEIGYEVDDAWKKCRQIYPVSFDKKEFFNKMKKKKLK